MKRITIKKNKIKYGTCKSEKNSLCKNLLSSILRINKITLNNIDSNFKKKLRVKNKLTYYNYFSYYASYKII